MRPEIPISASLNSQHLANSSIISNAPSSPKSRVGSTKEGQDSSIDTNKVHGQTPTICTVSNIADHFLSLSSFFLGAPSCVETISVKQLTISPRLVDSIYDYCVKYSFFSSLLLLTRVRGEGGGASVAIVLFYRDGVFPGDTIKSCHETLRIAGLVNCTYITYVV